MLAATYHHIRNYVIVSLVVVTKKPLSFHMFHHIMVMGDVLMLLNIRFSALLRYTEGGCYYADPPSIYIYLIYWQVMRLSCISMFRKGKRKYIVFRMFCCFPLLQIIYQIREMHGIEQLEEGYLVHFFFPSHETDYSMASYESAGFASNSGPGILWPVHPASCWGWMGKVHCSSLDITLALIDKRVS